jgi:hypothetical protein
MVEFIYRKSSRHSRSKLTPPRLARSPLSFKRGEKRGEIIIGFFTLFLLTIGCLSGLFADELYTKNKAAASHYNKGNYDEALKSYDNLILEFPQEPKLKMNKGSAQFKLNDFDKAEESYNSATSTKDKKALADLYYNLGNTQYMQAEQMASKGDKKAMDKYKAALENYIKSLDVRPSDKDAKWNVQLVQKKIKQQQQQQQQQQNNKDNKQNKDNKDQKQQQNNKDQDQKNKQDQNKKDQNKQDNKKQDQQNKDQNQNQDQKKEQQKPEPTPQQQKQEDMKKEEAKRIIEQFSDDEKDLNKKPEKIGIMKNKNIEKDW